MKKFTIMFLAALLIPLAQAFALSLEEAKQQGFVGEMPDGYLGIVAASPTDAVKSLVNEINSKRKAEYQAIAGSNKLDLATVEKLAGAKAIEKTPAGQFIKAAGSWQKK